MERFITPVVEASMMEDMQYFQMQSKKTANSGDASQN